MRRILVNTVFNLQDFLCRVNRGVRLRPFKERDDTAVIPAGISGMISIPEKSADMLKNEIQQM